MIDDDVARLNDVLGDALLPVIQEDGPDNR